MKAIDVYRHSHFILFDIYYLDGGKQNTIQYFRKLSFFFCQCGPLGNVVQTLSETFVSMKKKKRMLSLPSTRSILPKIILYIYIYIYG